MVTRTENYETSRTRGIRREGGIGAPVRVCVIAGYGINTDRELAYAFTLAGADAVDRIHVSDLTAAPETIERYDILGIPGGFSFGDHLGSGLVLAGIIARKLGPAISRFIAAGKPIIGICNGFQVLVKGGLLPNLSGTGKQEVSLIHNASGRFVARGVRIAVEPDSSCVWTRGLESLDLPIRHGEGRFIASDETLDLLERERLVAMRYEGEAPNGAERNIAGITDRTGLILGLMPHPEAYTAPWNHPLWHREGCEERNGVPRRLGFPGPLGIAILKNGVAHARARR